MQPLTTAAIAVQILASWASALEDSSTQNGYSELGIQTPLQDAFMTRACILLKLDALRDDTLIPEPSSPVPLLSPWTPIDTKRSLGLQTPADNDCPDVWYEIAGVLKRNFHGCSRHASTAIRFAFHDAGGYSNKTASYGPASGGADGSLLLSDAENNRADNNPMQGFRRWMLNVYETYSDRVGAADFIQVACSVAVHTCAGPVVKTVVGRLDDATAAPANNLPPAFGKGADHKSLIDLFAAKGIEPRELAALMGAHTVSRSFAEQERGGIPWGMPQDSSPRTWDNRYYAEMREQKHFGVARFESDVNLADPATVSGQAFTDFAKDAGAWATAFQDAMYKLSLLGISQDEVDGMIDCTDIIE